MSALFDEIAALMRTRRVFIVDTYKGVLVELSLEQYRVIAPLLDDRRAQVRFSEEVARKLCQRVAERKIRSEGEGGTGDSDSNVGGN